MRKPPKVPLVTLLGKLEGRDDVVLRKRFVRITVWINKPGQGSAPIQPTLEHHDTYSDMVGAALRVMPGEPSVRFPPVGHCIYCYATEYAPGLTRPLGEEHIVSEGLGGTVILPEASCRKCEGLTSAAERSVLSDSFHVVRHQLGVRMKRRTRGAKKFLLTLLAPDGSESKLSLPLDQHPTLLFLPRLLAPGILTGRPAGTSGIGGLWFHAVNAEAAPVGPEIVSPVIDTVRFAQFLAKTAHSLAVATVGECFKPLLLDFIRRKFARNEQYPECYHLVGGDDEQPAPSHALHEMGLSFTPRNESWFLNAHIRLFGNLGGPIYIVTVGTLKDGLTPEVVAARLGVALATL